MLGKSLSVCSSSVISKNFVWLYFLPGVYVGTLYLSASIPGSSILTFH